jgi:hypothetical protein
MLRAYGRLLNRGKLQINKRLAVTLLAIVAVMLLLGIISRG